MTHFLVTGGCGFIGSAFVRKAIALGHQITNLDAMTYAANPENLAEIAESPAYTFIKGDIRERACVSQAFRHKPDAVVHFAAETHVDRSIDGPMDFVTTNVDGTCTLLMGTHDYWSQLPRPDAERFRFLHVSTDEVYGSLGPEGLFTETSPIRPNSPYAASKASADLMVRAWHETYGLPVLTSNCSNNYGPYQFPEKLIPVVILNAVRGADIPVYGEGLNIRDWLHVDDHADALFALHQNGRLGETYNVGGNCELTNIELVTRICAVLDELTPAATPYAEQIRFVTDRPGHDLRYAIDATKIQSEIGWTPKRDIATGLEACVRWYLSHDGWCRRALERAGQNALPERLGLGAK